MLFHNITMIDYSRPLRARADSRKHVGPYRWTPAKPGSGRGFYQAANGLAMDPRGSSLCLRLEEANNHLRGSRLSNINGYYADNFQDTTLTPIIARLPHGRGFLAGWTMGRGMLACLEPERWDDEQEAAHAAHDAAERAAERAREASEEDDE